MPRHRELMLRNDEGQRIKHLREQLGYTQRDMAEEFGVSAAAIHQWETGERTVSGSALKLLALYEEAHTADLAATQGHTRPAAQAISRQLRMTPASFMWLVTYRLFAPDGRIPSTLVRRARLLAIRRFTEKLRELKGLAAKVGQVWSFVDFSLTEEERLVLGSLQTHAGFAMSLSAIEQLVMNELGQLPRKRFRQWTAKPSAVASIGQVHFARTHDGEAVAVKLQSPRAVTTLKADLVQVQALDQLFARLFRWAQPGAFFLELRARFLEECDYEVEAQNLALFRRLFEGQANIVIPSVHADLSTRKVLTMSLCTGRTFEDLNRLGTQMQKDRAGEILWRFYTESAFKHGVFNADPHPGNFLFDDEHVVFLDFGRVCRFSREFLTGWQGMVRKVLERNRAGTYEALGQMGMVSKNAVDLYTAFRVAAVLSRPLLTEGRFCFTERHLQMITEMFVSAAKSDVYEAFPTDTAFVPQLIFGVGSLLARLRANISVRAHFLDLLYAPGEARPAPYSKQELVLLGIE